ncbi:MAG: FAD:protein FMN transferase [Bacilli bacterium]|nr:FAD:protein FMN transferase [Bacilli bacterium]
MISKLYEGEQSNLDDIKDIFLYYDKVSDNYKNRDGITITKIGRDPITVEPQLYDLLKTSVEVKDSGATYFNPLVGRLSKKWKESLEKNEVLSDEIITAELDIINHSSLHFEDNNTVYKTGDAEIDLGGIVKGYALDKVSDYLKSQNIEKYLINAGFSSILLGKKDTDDGYFTVKISDLNNTYIKLKDCVVSTSSKSVQGVKIGDVTYSHIINPINGSAINMNDAVIVVSSSGALGDALSTSMMMNTVEEIKSIETSQNVQCIVVKDKQVIYCNEGLELYRG